MRPIRLLIALFGFSDFVRAAAEADLLVAYDNGYSDSVGGDANAEVLALNAVAASNLINERSGTCARMRICGYHKTWWQAGRYAALAAPQVSTTTGKLQVSFTRNTAATDLTLSVIAADTLTGPWSEIARSTNGAAFTAIAPGALVSETGTGSVKNVETTDIVLISDPEHPKRFMRLEVSR